MINKRDTKNNSGFDFHPIGDAIKDARERAGFTRTKLAEAINLSEEYLKAIENYGSKPSFDVFYRIMTFLNLSVDQFFYPDQPPKRSSGRRLVDTTLNQLGEAELGIVYSVAEGLSQITRRNAVKK
ncbi:MAG: helix-turn-helix transcriptional regulator [Clostridiales Family XIII bacterium]|jgi:transcriptional regulator with XRE-family HTH domain|nr:helix-turn-helix transcriptional regulator [Clostridiales Family XIII bacterium]